MLVQKNPVFHIAYDDGVLVSSSRHWFALDWKVHPGNKIIMKINNTTARRSINDLIL